MESKQIITRKTLNGNRRSLYVYLTDRGRELAKRIETEFEIIEKAALSGFSDNEKELLNDFLTRINNNISNKGATSDE